MNSKLCQKRLGCMHDHMAKYVERGELPGLVYAMARGDELHVDAIGAQAFSESTAMQRDTLFRIASMTKPVAAVAAMILVEECKLRLDDPVDRLLPELANRRVLKTLESPIEDTVPAQRPITLRDLLTFRMGLGLIMAPPNTYPYQRALAKAGIRQGPPRPQVEPDPDTWMQKLGSVPLLAQPGEKWLYDTAFDVLGVLVARAAGQSFESFLRDRIFAPLGMNDTAFYVPEAKLDRLATSYWLNYQTGKVEVFDLPRGDWSRAPAFASGSGGLVSTIDDYLAFGRMLLGQGALGKTRILSRSTVAAMTMDHLGAAEKAVSGLVPHYFDSHGWGFGMSVVTKRTDGTLSEGSVGWDGGLGTTFRADPKENLISILLTQRAFTSPQLPLWHQDFLTLAYQSLDA